MFLIDADPQGSLTISLGYEEPDEMEYSLATLMLNVVNDEKLNMEKTILHHKEGVDLIPANIELSAIEVSFGKCNEQGTDSQVTYGEISGVL